MTTPRITRTGALRADLAVVDAYDEKGLLVATLFPLAEEMEAARSLHGQHVRVTIEPADASERAALPTVEQIKTRLRGALPDYRTLGFEPNAKNVITDISAEVLKMIDEARR